MHLFYDYHIHTVFSGHSGPEMLVPAILDHAGRRGLRRIAVLEHAPELNRHCRAVFANTASDFPCPQFQMIREQLDYWHRQFPVEVVRAAEVDANPNLRDGSLLTTDLGGIQLVIASTHFLPGIPAFWYNLPENIPTAGIERMYDEWLDWICRVAANPKVDVLAHPGLEMAAVGAIRSFEGKVLDDFARLLKVCLEHDTAFELNESLAKKIPPEILRGYIDIIAAARDLGVKISPASDAHDLKTIGVFTWAGEIAAKINLGEEDLFQPLMAE